jgi:hypothetical protein
MVETKRSVARSMQLQCQPEQNSSALARTVEASYFPAQKARFENAAREFGHVRSSDERVGF